jgi:hypothetical protein
LQQRRFSRSRLTDDGEHFARVKLERHVTARALAAERFTQAVADEERLIIISHYVT